MSSKLSSLLLILLFGCKGSGVKPEEVAATTRGNVVIDNWGKGCGSGGVIVQINADTYFVNGSVPKAYEGTSTMPLPVWIRYQQDSPDLCTQSARIKILSIRKRE